MSDPVLQSAASKLRNLLQALLESPRVVVCRSPVANRVMVVTEDSVGQFIEEQKQRLTNDKTDAYESKEAQSFIDSLETPVYMFTLKTLTNDVAFFSDNEIEELSKLLDLKEEGEPQIPLF
jgi:hypothetical protein